MTSTALFTLRGLRKRYAPSFALQIDQLAVMSGETLGLLGPTGAGKSTLLSLLAGLASPTDGEIRFGGSPFIAAELPLTTRRRITLVHQHPVLLTDTVQRNVEYGLRLRAIAARSQRAADVLDRLHLTKIASQSAQTLSGGQIQLVALARALVIGPDVLLLDEPTAHLDPAHVALVEETIDQYQRESHATIVWATHNLFQTRRVAARTALLLNGELVEVACTRQFFTSPSDSRSRDFIDGRMIY